MIYLITDGKYLKIGYSENISNRMKSYSTHSNNFKLLSYKEGGTKDESILHEKYEKYNVRDEWFEYSQEIIDGFNNYESINESTNESEVVIYQSHLKTIYKNCSGYCINLYMVLLEELKLPLKGSDFSTFTTTNDDKIRWVNKLGGKDPHTLNYAIKQLKISGLIIKLGRGLYTINPKYAFCGGSKARYKAMQSLNLI